MASVTCNRCHDVGWVCERHLDSPHANELANGCECASGVPCPDCKRHAGRSVRRVRAGRTSPPVSGGAAIEHASRKSSGMPSERRQGFQREVVAVRAQLRRR
jgi:hypothetical protein